MARIFTIIMGAIIAIIGFFNFAYVFGLIGASITEAEMATFPTQVLVNSHLIASIAIGLIGIVLVVNGVKKN